MSGTVSSEGMVGEATVSREKKAVTSLRLGRETDNEMRSQSSFD